MYKNREQSIILLDILKSLRLKKNNTQKDISARLKRQYSFVCKYEKGEKRLDILEFTEICIALGYDPLDVYKELLEKIKLNNK